MTEAWEAACVAARRELQRAIDDLDQERARAERAESERDEAVRKLAEAQAAARRNLDLLAQETTVAERDAAIDRAERAEAQLAALRDACERDDYTERYKAAMENGLRVIAERDEARADALRYERERDEARAEVDAVRAERDAESERADAAQRREEMYKAGAATFVARALGAEAGLAALREAAVAAESAETLRAYQRDRDAAIDRAEAAEMCDACSGSGRAASGPCGCGGTGKIADMLRSVRLAMHDQRTRAEAAEAGLAALREKAAAHHRDGNRETWTALYDVLADTAAAAEAYARRLRAEALREAARRALGPGSPDTDSSDYTWSAWLDGLADEIEGAR